MRLVFMKWTWKSLSACQRRRALHGQDDNVSFSRVVLVYSVKSSPCAKAYSAHHRECCGWRLKGCSLEDAKPLFARQLNWMFFVCVHAVSTHKSTHACIACMHDHHYYFLLSASAVHAARRGTPIVTLRDLRVLTLIVFPQCFAA